MMRTYYVLNAALSFGFCGFVRKAFVSREQAEYAEQQLLKKYRNVTEHSIEEVQASNKKEAESNRPSMFAGEFKGIDKVEV